MRKQGIWVTRFVFLLLFLFVVAFMGYHIIDAVSDPMSTVAAVLTESDDFIRANGFFVRDEQTIDRPGGVVEVLMREGQRVATNESVAVIYDDADAQRVSSQVSELSRRVEQLEEVRRLSADIADTSKLAEFIDESLYELLARTDARDLASVHDSGLELRSLLYKWEATYTGGVDLDALIAELTVQRDQTQAQLSGRSTPVSVGVSGTFSPYTDGYETILTPAFLNECDVSRWDQFLNSAPPITPSGALGKVACGFSFYYATVLSAEEAAFLKPGQALSICLTGEEERFSMNVSRIDEADDGRCFVVLESRSDMSRFVSLRGASIDIRLASYSGIRVPREAIRVNEEGQSGVYCVVLTQAQFKSVEILQERDTYYLVSYTPEKLESLRPGDEILIGGKDLYDGKNIR